jgi:hypothetical protein
VIGVPRKATKNDAPEAISLVAVERASSLRLMVSLLAVAFLAAFAMFGWFRAEARFANEARLTFVKLAPNGTWTLDQDMGENVMYYDATLRTVLYDWIHRRYSKRSATILSDWGIANAMYSPALQQWFGQEFKAIEVAAEQAQCANCPQIEMDVRAHQHIDPLPTDPGLKDSDPVRTLLYATEREVPAGSLKATREDRKLFRVTWRLLAKQKIQARPDLLRYNPIGVEIIEVEVTDDPSK